MSSGSEAQAMDTTALKALVQKLTVSGTKERQELFQTVQRQMKQKELQALPDGAVKALCKVLPQVLPRYTNGPSRKFALDLVTALLDCYPGVSPSALCASLLDAFSGWRNSSPSTGNAKTAMAALKWTMAIGKKAEPTFLKDDPSHKFIHLQSVLLHVILGSEKKRIIRSATNAIYQMWKVNPELKKALFQILSGSTLEPNPQTLVLSSYLIHCLHKEPKKEAGDNAKTLESLQPIVLEQLIKLVISSKTKPALIVIKNLRPFCSYIQHEAFKTSLLPAMQKAMLRNPELCLESIAHLLGSLKIDLSQYVGELQKPFGTNLHAKDDLTRDYAVMAVASLAGQCSDPEAVQTLLKTIFAVLGGSEGKLSVNTQKISLITAAGCVCKNAVTGSQIQNVCAMAIGEFIKVLETEVHEGTLLTCLEQCSLWMAKLIGGIPEPFLSWFPKGITAKSSTSNIRSSYFTTLGSALDNGTNLSSAVKLIPTMMRTVENCTKQAAQIAIVTEGVQASRCLVKLSALGPEVEDKLADFWKIVLDQDKLYFVNDRFLLAAPGFALKSLVDIAEKVLQEMSVENVKQSAWLKAMAVALMSSETSTRTHAQASIKKIVFALGGDNLGMELLSQMSQHFSNVTVVETSLAQEGLTSKEGSENINVSAKSVVDALFAMVNGSKFGDEAKAAKFAGELLKVCHQPSVHNTYPGLWNDLVKKLELTPAAAVEKNGKVLEVLVELISTPSSNASAGLAVETVVEANPDILVPKIIDLLAVKLRSGKLSVSVEDFETYLTPEGELFDKRVLEQIQNEGDASKNIKRESKAYSYKEQMEEIALRKELEEKRRREGKVVQPKLTPKQKEMLNAQLEKESKIRAEVAAIKNRVQPALMLLASAVKGSPKVFASLVSKTMDSLFLAFTSPITASQATQVFFDLRRAVFDECDETLSQVIAALTIQIKKPSCPQPHALKSDKLRKSAKSVASQIGENTVLSMYKGTDEDSVCPLMCPAFNYSFCLIEYAMKKHLKEDDFIYKCCDIISEHAGSRGMGDQESLDAPDLTHPKYLPIPKMLRFLIEVISTIEGRSQQAAVQTLIEVSSACSGKCGCAKAGKEEIEILLGSLQNNIEAVRDAGLRGLLAMITALPKEGDSLRDLIVRRVWVAKFDPCEENQDLANRLWQTAQFRIYDGLNMEMIDDIVHPVACVRSSGAEALAKLLEKDQEDTHAILTLLLDTYKDKLEMTPAVIDGLGRMAQEPIDHWEPRSGVAIAISKMAPFFNVEMVQTVASFLVPDALGDRHETVRTHMLDAALATIDIHGKETADELLPVFNTWLEKASSSGSNDNVRQSVVILMGSLAKHLDTDDPKVRPIMRQLIIALNTPSQQVQEEVAKCLPPLVPTIKDEAPVIVSDLIKTLLGAKNNYGERKGAAYGIAGIVKGLGILSLKQLDIMGRLTEAIQDKKNPTHREGALFAFEMLCNMLGRLFEPYIVHILPHLLLCFGDSVEHVRLAADDTARAVMKKLSAHGVKLVLPSLLNALEEDQWRTKTGSVELLGAMAYCAPKQLSSCLPSIVPKLIEVLGDSHHKVQTAGVQALTQIGNVIRNPEIQAIVPILLEALQDPAKKTGTCLQTLLDTKFVHFIDAPSLALIMPVVQRAFQDRSTETRKMAAQIIGNMYSLTDQKDLKPYLPGIIPGLKNSLLDPVPEVRAVSARALGAMVRGMGEESFEDLLPWLMSTLTSESSSVDRSGAAQGLAEVVGGLGVDKMNTLMPDIIKTAERQDIAPHVKDGYIMMFIYMPSVFPEEFTKYIGQIISPVLRALADEQEFVRDTAYKAGQRLVIAYADTALTLLLPELEKGLFDDNWRIRHSSVQLLGDLLYKVSGVSGKMTTETGGDDDNFGTEASQKVIINVLGMERRNRVLAGLYMGRSDVALMVRQASLHVWKVIVSNTPKTLREVLPTLFNLLLGCLASNSYDKRQVAARTLGDLVKKLGERVLPEIIPILEKGLDSEQPEKRQGVCVGLSEIMQSTSRDMVLSFVDSLVPTVRKALCDDLPEVRESAAKTFDSLHNTVGSRALDDILPPMLEQLDDAELHDNTLDGLRQVMAIKSRAVLPYLVPQLVAKPVNTKALANLAPVAGEALHRHLSRILPALLEVLAETHGTDEGPKQQEYAQTVILAISDEESDLGVSIIMEELMGSCKSQDNGLKRGAVALLHAFCSQTKVDYSNYVSQLIRALILLFTEEDKLVLTEAWHALAAVTKTLDASEQMEHVADVRQAVRFAMSDLKKKDEGSDKLLPGFCLPKGIQPILPIFRESILNGHPELKEQASIGLGEVISVTSAEALKPSVVHITGPLIRILGDRFNAAIKTAVLDTLASLLSKAKDMLKPFFPQLQTTFQKALVDTNRSVRLKAGIALSFLITIHLRPDPLFNELCNGIKTADEIPVKDTYIQALRGCIVPAGERMSPPIRKQTFALLISHLSHVEDSSRTAASGCLGAFCKWLPEEDVATVVEEYLSFDDVTLDWTVRHGRSTALFVALKDAAHKVYLDKWAKKIDSTILAYLNADRIPIVENGVRAAGYLFQFCIAENKPVPASLILPFCKTINHGSNDVKLLFAVMSTFLAKQNKEVLPVDLLKPLLPMLVNGTKEKNSAVKSSSETALVALLHMRKTESADGQKKCLSALEAGARDALQDVITKVLEKVANQPEGKEEVIDNTIQV